MDFSVECIYKKIHLFHLNCLPEYKSKILTGKHKIYTFFDKTKLDIPHVLIGLPRLIFDYTMFLLLIRDIC